MIEDITQLVETYSERAYYKETLDKLVSYSTQTSELFRNANISLDAGIQLITSVDEQSPEREYVESLYTATRKIVDGIKLSNISVSEAISALEALADGKSGSIALSNVVYKALSEKHAHMQSTKTQSVDNVYNSYPSVRNSGGFKCTHQFRDGNYCSTCGVKKEETPREKKGLLSRAWAGFKDFWNDSNSGD
ncbi:hypothetical protein KW805_00090 [Candidatus Pacearchaeota archaeon]|nr:hypothetical protein [Candidatus Pacearchaeota archaeon]